MWDSWTYYLYITRHNHELFYEHFIPWPHFVPYFTPHSTWLCYLLSLLPLLTSLWIPSWLKLFLKYFLPHFSCCHYLFHICWWYFLYKPGHNIIIVLKYSNFSKIWLDNFISFIPRCHNFTITLQLYIFIVQADRLYQIIYAMEIWTPTQ